MDNQFSIISILGRSGAGKGSQVKLLQKDTEFHAIRTGDLLRQRAQQTDVVGQRVQYILENGLLIPTPVVFSLWMPILEDAYNNPATKGVIFDGNPRKLYEAQMLDEVLEMFEWTQRFRVIYIDVSRETAKQRLLGRMRPDDTEEKINSRLEWFESDVQPVLDYYRNKNILLEVNGEQPIDHVYAELRTVLDNFLK